MMEFKTGWNRIYLLQALTLLCLVLGPTFVDSYVNFYPSRFHRFGGYSRGYGYHFPAYNAYHWSHSNSVAVPSYQQRNLTRTQSYYTTPSKSTTMAPRLPPPHATPESRHCIIIYNIFCGILRDNILPRSFIYSPFQMQLVRTYYRVLLQCSIQHLLFGYTVPISQITNIAPTPVYQY